MGTPPPLPQTPRPARRLLIVTTEPPPTSSGLGTLWAKLALGAAGPDLEIDFLGPDPVRCSTQGVSGLPVSGRVHELGRPPLSRIAGVGRSRATGARRAAWGLLRAPSALIERATGGSAYAGWIGGRVASLLPALLREGRYDAVAAKAPPLQIAETVRRAAREARTPFVYIMGDPIGHRDEGGGVALARPALQQELIAAAAGFVTRRTAYERYYAGAFRIDPERMAFFEDSFIPDGRLEEREAPWSVGEDAILLWGQVDPWRPLGTLLAAIAGFNDAGRAAGRGPRGLTVMGRIVEERERALARRALGPLLREEPGRPYLEARAVARTARRFVVLVSSRHRDNIPSRLIDALAFGRPILLLAHPASASWEMVRRLGVGPVADIREVSSIIGGLAELEERRGEFERAFTRPELAEEWGYEGVGRRFRDQLFRALGWREGRAAPS